MQQISRQEKDLLIKHNILQMIGGRYPDLAIVGRKKKSRCKKYFVPDYMAMKARLLQSETDNKHE